MNVRDAVAIATELLVFAVVLIIALHYPTYVTATITTEPVGSGTGVARYIILWNNKTVETGYAPIIDGRVSVPLIYVRVQSVLVPLGSVARIGFYTYRTAMMSVLPLSVIIPCLTLYITKRQQNIYAGLAAAQLVTVIVLMMALDGVPKPLI